MLCESTRLIGTSTVFVFVGVFLVLAKQGQQGHWIPFSKLTQPLQDRVR